MVMGTAHYIAPEQALGQQAEPASDVYSLAVVGYECLVGHRPFLSENAVTVAMMHIRDVPPPLPPDVPPGTRALIEATLVKDPRQRYRSGGEFACAVTAIRSGRPLPVPSGLATAGTPIPLATPPVTHPPGAHPATSTMPPTPHVSRPVRHHMAPQGGTVGSAFAGMPPIWRPHRRVGLWVLIVVLVVVVVGLATWVITLATRNGGGTPPAPGSPAITRHLGEPSVSAQPYFQRGVIGYQPGSAGCERNEMTGRGETVNASVVGTSCASEENTR